MKKEQRIITIQRGGGKETTLKQKNRKYRFYKEELSVTRENRKYGFCKEELSVTREKKG